MSAQRILRALIVNLPQINILNGDSSEFLEETILRRVPSCIKNAVSTHERVVTEATNRSGFP